MLDYEDVAALAAIVKAPSTDTNQTIDGLPRHRLSKLNEAGYLKWSMMGGYTLEPKARPLIDQLDAVLRRT